MIRRPPRSTRTDTLFPYTTRFRSTDSRAGTAGPGSMPGLVVLYAAPGRGGDSAPSKQSRIGIIGVDDRCRFAIELLGGDDRKVRSEERREGNECDRTCRSLCSPYNMKKKQTSKLYDAVIQ